MFLSIFLSMHYDQHRGAVYSFLQPLTHFLFNSLFAKVTSSILIVKSFQDPRLPSKYLSPLSLGPL